MSVSLYSELSAHEKISDVRMSAPEAKIARERKPGGPKTRKVNKNKLVYKVVYKVICIILVNLCFHLLLLMNVSLYSELFHMKFRESKPDDLNQIDYLSIEIHISIKTLPPIMVNSLH